MRRKTFDKFSLNTGPNKTILFVKRTGITDWTKVGMKSSKADSQNKVVAHS